MDFQSQQRIDEIFKELKKESKIQIVYKIIEVYGRVKTSALVSVNRCSTFPEFSDRLTRICEKIITSFFEQIQNLPPLEISSFANLFLENFQNFKRFTKTDTDGSFNESNSFHYFVNAQIHCENDNHDDYIPMMVHPLVIDFAQYWNDIIDSSILKISKPNKWNNSAKVSVGSQGKQNATPPLSIAAYQSKKHAQHSSCVTELLASLKLKGFVAKETDLKEFKKIFNNARPNPPIKWLTGISDLAYFIKYIHLDLKAIDYLGNKIWKVTAWLFVDSNGDPFPSSRFKGQKKPAQANLLMKIASHLK